MNRPSLALLLVFLLSVPPAQAALSPPEVHRQIERIVAEINALKLYFQVSKQAEPVPFRVVFAPRHLWYKSYELFIKLNLLRARQDLPALFPPVMAPRRQISLTDLLEQNQRLLLELRLLRNYLGIEQPEILADEEEGDGELGHFSLSDDYNSLSQASRTLDLLNGVEVTPSDVFAEVMRIISDVDNLLAVLDIQDNTVPPPRYAQAKPRDVFGVGLQVLEEIRRLHEVAGMKSVDFYPLQTLENISPSEVFSLTGLILAELQPLKAHLGLHHEFTDPARHYEARVPADVLQLMGWTLRKLQQLRARFSSNQL